MPIDAKKNMATPFNKIFRCTTCDTGTIVPLPEQDDIEELYHLPNYYTHGESHIRYVSPSFRDKVLIKLAWMLDDSRPFDPVDITHVLPTSGRVCDIGCGKGDTLKRFQGLGLAAVGVDPDSSARNLAAASGITVLPGTAEAPPSELVGEQFDLVIMSHTVEHCIDPRKAIRNAFLLTKEGGYFYCEVPNCACRHFDTFTVCSENFDTPRHLWFFTAKGLRRLVEENGFTFGEWRFSGFTRHHSPGWRNWELEIFDRLAKHGKANLGKRHTFSRSLCILAKSAFAPAATKYDCVGIISRKMCYN